MDKVPDSKQLMQMEKFLVWGGNEVAIKITDKKNCTGCAACSNICPKNCITMESDNMGFSYPKVDSSSCIECGLCEKSCPLLAEDSPQHFTTPMVYAAYSKDKALRFNSTSGGIFTELARKVIRQGGVVSGAKYDNDNMVEHCLIDDEKDLDLIRQSKYLQSRIGYIYREIKNNLLSGKKVAFCGAPCQVASLYQYLGKDWENLITIDFICRGMNSPKAYYYWLKELEQVNGSKARRVWFKYKENGWKASPRCTRVDFENGESKVYSGKENLFMCGYLGPNLYIRPSCGDCHFKGAPRRGDITLADFWGLESKLEDDGGTSMVMLNSDKGKELFECIRDNIICEKHNYSEIGAGNVCATDSVPIPKMSEAFLSELGTLPFSRLIDKYTRVSLPQKIWRKVKRIWKKL